MSAPEDERTIKAQTEAIRKLRKELEEAPRDIERIDIREAWDAEQERQERYDRRHE